jgi:hypothetical protein
MLCLSMVEEEEKGVKSSLLFLHIWPISALTFATRGSDRHNIRQLALAIDLAYISHNANVRNTRKPLNGWRGRRIPASAPFRPSGLRRNRFG